MTLILPAFVALIALAGRRPARARFAVAFTATFTFGMATAISPWTWHTYQLTGRFIPVSAQSGDALWAPSQRAMPRDANHYRWWNKFSEQQLIYHEVTGAARFSVENHLRHHLALEDEYRRRAIENIRRQPGVFLYNAVQNLTSYLLDINSVFIKLFQAAQTPGRILSKRWLEVGHPQTFYPAGATRTFEALTNLYTWFALLAVILAIRRRDASLAVPAGIFLCLGIAHAITVFDLMFYYIKLPFLVIFFAYFLDAAPDALARVTQARTARRVTACIAGGMGGLTLALDAWLFL